MRRRAFITLVGTTVAVLPFSASAQRPAKRPLIAVLNLNSALSASPRVRGFVRALHELGYLEGRDFDLAERYADGRLEHLSTLADELFRLSPAVFVTGSVPATLAVRDTSKTVPIVGVGLVNPVSLGLAESEARPRGQVTGTLI